MHRDEADIELLSELAGVLDQTVIASGLTSGTYLVLRELPADESPMAITGIAERLGADPEEVVELVGRLVDGGYAGIRTNGIAVTSAGAAMAERIEADANVAIREYVLDRPHTATVYGLVAAMQTGRFTVTDLIAFIQEGPGDGETNDNDGG